MLPMHSKKNCIFPFWDMMETVRRVCARPARTIVRDSEGLKNCFPKLFPCPHSLIIRTLDHGILQQPPDALKFSAHALNLVDIARHSCRDLCRIGLICI